MNIKKDGRTLKEMERDSIIMLAQTKRRMFRVGESGAHDRLKEFYKSYLEKRGYRVCLEKRIMNGKYRIDVYGENVDDVVLVEIGTIQRKGKLEELRANFKKVIHIPYIDAWLSWPWPKDNFHLVPKEVKQEWIRRIGESLR